MWLTADVHYTAAHYYDPNKAVFQDFEPFWEFVSGPIHAGSFGPEPARQHVRPAARLHEGADRRSRARTSSPIYGLQFFGHVAIDGATGVMTVTLKDWDDNALWSTTLEPKKSCTPARLTALMRDTLALARLSEDGRDKPGHDETLRAGSSSVRLIYSGTISGLLLGNFAMTDGSMLRVWATMDRGVCASQSDSDTSSNRGARKISRNTKSVLPVFLM